MTAAPAITVTLAIAVALLIGYHVGVRVRAYEVERATLAIHAASLAAQTAAIEATAARLVTAERERFDARVRSLIELVAPLVQADIQHNAHDGRAVAAAQALYAAQRI